MTAPSMIGTRRPDLGNRTDLKRDLRELSFLEFARARPAVHDPLAEAEPARVQGDVDVLVEILPGEAPPIAPVLARSLVTPTTV